MIEFTPPWTKYGEWVHFKKKIFRELPPLAALHRSRQTCSNFSRNVREAVLVLSHGLNNPTQLILE